MDEAELARLKYAIEEGHIEKWLAFHDDTIIADALIHAAVDILVGGPSTDPEERAAMGRWLRRRAGRIRHACFDYGRVLYGIDPPHRSDPYACIGPRCEHEVQGDNPMMTGRCMICRKFVGRTQRGWRTINWTMAHRWGLHGARRSERVYK